LKDFCFAVLQSVCQRQLSPGWRLQGIEKYCFFLTGKEMAPVPWIVSQDASCILQSCRGLPPQNELHSAIMIFGSPSDISQSSLHCCHGSALKAKVTI
jgi:hypothetical protein